MEESGFWTKIKENMNNEILQFPPIPKDDVDETVIFLLLCFISNLHWLIPPDIIRNAHIFLDHVSAFSKSSGHSV